MTAFDEAPLLHEPDLMLAVLRVAAAKPGTLDDCIEYLRTLRRCAQVRELMPAAEVRAFLETAEAKLRRAGLIEVPAPGRFCITARGREVLEDNPDGVDDTVLMQLPEFRPVNGHAVTAPAVRAAPAATPQASNTEYHMGFEAFLAGVGLADNPHAPDVRAYLDWENGWSQARDSQLKEHPGAESGRRCPGKGDARRRGGRASDP